MDLLEEVDEEKDIHQDETSVEMCWGITPMEPEKVRQQEDRDVADELRAAVKHVPIKNQAGFNDDKERLQARVRTSVRAAAPPGRLTLIA